MHLRGPIITALLICGVALSAAGSALAQETVTIKQASFSPNRLGSATDVFGSATIASTTGPVPSPITHIDVFGPAGVTLDLRGSATCDKESLERVGASACPANSKAGIGGGEGIYQLGSEIVKEHYTVEFFLTDNRPGHTRMVIYLKGSTPVQIELYFDATIIKGPKPYGLGFSLDVPLIKVLPEASDASATSAFLRLGAHNRPYYKKVHGKRKLFHIRGIVLPNHCPHGGWPVASRFDFQDGSTVMAKRTIDCPR
ncbi:MAG TPA: hypothetical protein VFY36_06890 [Solirubrobacteraceae bacterium]|nr:hypothetical protein [Solirubrobacteraceae bacterium]